MAGARRWCGAPNTRVVRIFNKVAGESAPKASVTCNTGEVEFQLRGARRKRLVLISAAAAEAGQ